MPLPFASARVVRDGTELLSLGTGLPILACRTREEAHAEKRAHPGGGSLPEGRRQRSGRQRLLDRFGQIFRQLLIPLRDVIGLEIGDGTAQTQKIVIARELLGREFKPY
ncbi:hypothetical protein [Kyrpidia tusciae]|nr:hypothetical protein [Kyrpidia tusciae]